MKNNEKRSSLASLKKTFNVRLWSDADRLKSFFLFLLNAVKSLFIPQQKDAPESFEAAQARLKMTDADMGVQIKALFRLSLLMSSIAFLFLMYVIYQLVYGSLQGALLTLAMVLVALAFAFRYHFWYFQLKQGQLGCTISMWFKQGLLGGK